MNSPVNPSTPTFATSRGRAFRCGAMLIVAAGLFLANYPGRAVHSDFCNQWLDSVVRYRVSHGWPWTWCTDIQWVHNKNRWSSDGFDWSEFSLWSWNAADAQWNGLALVGDAFVASGILALVHWFLARDRFRLALLFRGQFSLVHLLLLTAAVSLGLGVWNAWRFRRDWRTHLADELWDKAAMRPKPVPDFPAWCRQAVGDKRLLQTGWTVPQGGTLELHPGFDELDRGDIGPRFVREFPSDSMVRVDSGWSGFYTHLPGVENLNGVEATEEDLDLLVHTPHVRALALIRPIHFREGMSFTGEQARRLLVLKHLEHLTLPDFQPIQGDVIRELAKLPKLQSLSLRYWYLAPEGRKALGELKNLRLLFVDAHGIKSGDLAPLAKLTHLEALQLHYADIEDEDMAELKDCVNLRWLEVLQSRVGNRGLAFLRNHKRLAHLNTFRSRVGDDSLPVLATLSELRVLDCRHGKFRHVRDFPIEKLPRLIAFDFSSNRVAYRERALLNEKFPHLNLITPATGFGGHDQAVVEWDFPNCFNPKDQTMRLGSPDVNDEAIGKLADEFAAGRLAFTKLHLTRADVSDAGVSVLCRLQHLEELSLDSTPLTSHGIAQLQGFPRLRKLYLDPSHLSPASVEQLKRLPALKEIVVSGELADAPDKKAALKRYQADLPQLK